MPIKMIAVGNKMPSWVNLAVAEYTKRLPADYRLELIEIANQKRTKTSAPAQLMELEGKKLLEAAHSPIIALDRQGIMISTEQLAKQLQQWHDQSETPCLLIGGPEGLAPLCLKRADKIWSLSALTFPHPLVRVIIAEQVYRAWSLLSHHPYHRF